MSVNGDKNGDGYIDLQEDVAYTPQRSSKLDAYRIKSPYLRECFAEFIGTMTLLAFGDGVVAQVKLGQGNNGNYTHISLCWGIAVLLGIHASGGVSGAHLNPAVTTTLALFGRFEWRKVPGYILAQVLGGFCGAAIVYFAYYPLFHFYDPTLTTTQGVFATYPHANVPNATAFLTEFIGTAFLLAGIFAFGDEQNKPASPYSSPSAVALLVVAIGMAFGMNSGYAINPARDFGPRLFSSIAGWGSRVFTLDNHYFWIPVVGPICGGAFGGFTYFTLVEMHHPKQE